MLFNWMLQLLLFVVSFFLPYLVYCKPLYSGMELSAFIGQHPFYNHNPFETENKKNLIDHICIGKQDYLLLQNEEN